MRAMLFEREARDREREDSYPRNHTKQHEMKAYFRVASCGARG